MQLHLSTMQFRFQGVLLWLFINIPLSFANVDDRLFANTEAGFPDFAAKIRRMEVQKNATEYLVDTLLQDRGDRFAALTWMSIFKQEAQDERTSAGLSPKCLSDLLATQTALSHNAEFAKKMQDAAAKMPSGEMEGSLAWLGAYDECRNISAVTNTTSFKGEYCVGKVDLKSYFSGQHCKVLPDCRVVAGTSGLSFYFGVCLPNSCDEGDATVILTRVIHQQLHLDLNVTATCSTPQPWTNGDYVAIVICSILGLLVLLGTLLEMVKMYCRRPDGSADKPNTNRYETLTAGIHSEVSGRTGLLSGSLAGSYDNSVNELGIKITESPPAQTLPERIFLSFSIISNGRKLFNTHTSEGQLTALNGMRVLSMWWVIQGHTFGFSEGFLDNLLIIPGLLKRFTFQALGNATFSVDSFFFLSGLLVAYLTLNALRESNGKINWVKFILHRFWRLTPALAFCIMFYSTLFLHLVDGPLVKTMLQGDMFQACKTVWWANLLYINNFYPSYGDIGKQCVGWTWYLANDMQFYLISPLLLYPLYRWRRVGIAMVMFLIITCLIVRSVIARVYQMCAGGCPITHHTEDLYAHHDVMYNKPFTRMAPYLVGMLTGHILSVTKCRLKMNKFLVALGWLIAAAVNISVLYGLYGLYHGQVFSPDINALYIGTSRFAWSLGLAWVALACITGKGGPVNDILSWRVWAPLGRLTYCAYLWHPLVLFCYYGSRRTPVHYTDLELSTVFVGNLTLSYAVAFLVSMLIEAPMLSLEKLVFKKR